VAFIAIQPARTAGDPAPRSAARLGHARYQFESRRSSEGGAGTLRANIGITLDTHSHVTAGLQADAAEQVAALFAPVSHPLSIGHFRSS
jgi:hypothetical protein